MNPSDRRNALTVAEANLLWLLLDDRFGRAEQILLDGDLQAAIVRAQNPAGATRPTEGSTGWSDPTATAALAEAATELRANEVRRTWRYELRDVCGAVEAVHAMTAAALGEQVAPRPASITAALRSLRWLTIVPWNRIATVHHHIDGEDLAELDHAIGWCHDRSQALRSGTLTTTSGKRAPSVHAVLESARKVTEAMPPPPKQKPLEGCVSCSRDGGHFTPIDLKHHSARNMCRVCGDYASGEGEWLPIDAVRYMHRTGKQLTWKIIEQAKRVDKAG